MSVFLGLTVVLMNKGMKGAIIPIPSFAALALLEFFVRWRTGKVQMPPDPANDHLFIDTVPIKVNPESKKPQGIVTTLVDRSKVIPETSFVSLFVVVFPVVHDKRNIF